MMEFLQKLVNKEPVRTVIYGALVPVIAGYAVSGGADGNVVELINAAVVGLVAILGGEGARSRVISPAAMEEYRHDAVKVLQDAGYIVSALGDVDEEKG